LIKAEYMKARSTLEGTAYKARLENKTYLNRSEQAI